MRWACCDTNQHRPQRRAAPGPTAPLAGTSARRPSWPGLASEVSVSPSTALAQRKAGHGPRPWGIWACGERLSQELCHMLPARSKVGEFGGGGVPPVIPRQTLMSCGFFLSAQPKPSPSTLAHFFFGLSFFVFCFVDRTNVGMSFLTTIDKSDFTPLGIRRDTPRMLL